MEYLRRHVGVEPLSQGGRRILLPTPLTAKIGLCFMEAGLSQVRHIPLPSYNAQGRQRRVSNVEVLRALERIERQEK